MEIEYTCQKCYVVFKSTKKQKFCSESCRPQRIRNVDEKPCDKCGSIFKPKFKGQKYCSDACKKAGFSEKRAKAPETRNCLNCGVEFTTKKKTKRYCTQKCSRHLFDPLTLTCATCSKQFTVAYRFREQKTCGFECAKTQISKTLTTREVLECLACGKHYSVVQSYKNDSKYCSYDCFLSTRNTRQPDVIKICETCNTEFSVVFSKSEQRFCGHSCASTGENNGVYGKPGIMTGKIPWNNGLTKETNETIAKIAEINSEMFKEQFRSGKRTHVGKNNPMYGHITTDEQRNRHSEAAIKRVLSGVSGYKTNHITGEYVSKKMNMMFRFKSSWELAVMMQLDADANVINYVYEPDVILLKDGRRAIPDFFVTDVEKSYYIEVKPTSIQKLESVKEKLLLVEEALNDLGFNYVLYGDSEIKEIKLKLGLEYENEDKNYQSR